MIPKVQTLRRLVSASPSGQYVAVPRADFLALCDVAEAADDVQRTTGYDPDDRRMVALVKALEALGGAS